MKEKPSLDKTRDDFNTMAVAAGVVGTKSNSFAQQIPYIGLRSAALMDLCVWFDSKLSHCG